jgi:hypothetical protein
VSCFDRPLPRRLTIVGSWAYGWFKASPGATSTRSPRPKAGQHNNVCARLFACAALGNVTRATDQTLTFVRLLVSSRICPSGVRSLPRKRRYLTGRAPPPSVLISQIRVAPPLVAV